LSGLLDADGDGEVTDAEAKKAAEEFQKQGNSKGGRSADILNALDKNKDGKVGRDEAEDGVAAERMKTESGKRMAEMFKTLDGDGDGVVTKREFGALPKQLGPFGAFIERSLPRLWDNFDANRDGKMTLTESLLGIDQLAQGQGAGDRDRFRGWWGRGRDREKEAEEERNKQAATIAQTTMTRLDKDKDGQINLKESKRDNVLKQKLNFDAVDENSDEQLSIEEMVAYLKEHLPKKEVTADRDDRRPFRDFDRGRRRGR
jgi:Ca2+-binding EF-hand superfamily protein